MSQKTHLELYLEAVHNCDDRGTVPHMAEDVSLLSPLLPAPVEGRSAVAKILAGLLNNIDAFEMKHLIGGGPDFVAIFSITAGEHKVDGMDHMHVNGDGLVDSMTVAWRPLPQVVGVQQRLARALGLPALELVESQPSPGQLDHGDRYPNWRNRVG